MDTTTKSTTLADPWAKWAGGKRSFAREYMADFLPEDFEDRPYVEPMIGGGACFFRHGVRAKSAHISDINVRLMMAYQGIRDTPELVNSLLYDMGYGKTVYLETRELFNHHWVGSSHAQVAAWFIFLNRSCFNGVYRENAKGHFNVPYGDGKWGKEPSHVAHAQGLITAASEALQGVDIRSGSIPKLLKWCPDLAFIYLDPPYVLTREFAKQKGFTGYSAGGYTETDLRALSKISKMLSKRGCKVMISHADVPVAHKVFAWMKKRPMVADTSVSQGAGRGTMLEVVLTSY